MADGKRAVAALSVSIGEFIRRMRAERGWGQEDLANRMNKTGVCQPVHKVAIGRFEAGTQELRVGEIQALHLVFGRPMADFMDPRAAEDRDLRELAAKLTAARDTLWTASAAFYDTAHALGDEYLRAASAERARSVTDVIDGVIKVTPPSVTVPEFVRKDIRDVTAAVAQAGMRHPALLLALNERAARLEAQIRLMEKATPDDWDILGDKSPEEQERDLREALEDARDELGQVYDRIDAVREYEARDA